MTRYLHTMSWARWESREQADAAVPFLRVERIEQNVLIPELYEVSLAGNLTTRCRGTRTCSPRVEARGVTQQLGTPPPACAPLGAVRR